jgi:hypothetical protein
MCRIRHIVGDRSFFYSRGSLCHADIPEALRQPLCPGTGRADWCLIGCAWANTPASCSTASSGRAEASFIRVFAD